MQGGRDEELLEMEKMLKPTMHNYSELVMHADATLGCRSAFGSGHQKIHIHIVARVFESYACHTVYHFTVMHCDAL